MLLVTIYVDKTPTGTTHHNVMNDRQWVNELANSPTVLFPDSRCHAWLILTPGLPIENIRTAPSLIRQIL